MGIFRNKNVFRNIFRLFCSWEQNSQNGIQAFNENSSQTNAYLLYSNYSYSGLIPNERALSVARHSLSVCPSAILNLGRKLLTIDSYSRLKRLSRRSCSGWGTGDTAREGWGGVKAGGGGAWAWALRLVLLPAAERLSSLETQRQLIDAIFSGENIALLENMAS